MIHRKKNAPALQRRDVSTVSLVSSCFREFAYVFFSWVFLYCAFLLSGSDLSSTPCIGLLCLLRMHTINSCVGDT